MDWVFDPASLHWVDFGESSKGLSYRDEPIGLLTKKPDGSYEWHVFGSLSGKCETSEEATRKMIDTWAHPPASLTDRNIAHVSPPHHQIH
jgi:hypothetical protein